MPDTSFVKRRIPGIQVHRKCLSNLKEELDKIHAEIAHYKGLITSESARQRDAFPHTLFNEKDLIIKEIKELNQRRSELMQTRDALFAELEQCRPVRKGPTPSQLEEMKLKIEERMMNGTYTAREEKDFQVQLESIHKQRASLGDVQGKEKRANALDKKIGGIKAELDGIFAELKGRRSELEELKKVIDGLKEKGRVKSPVIIKYEEKVSELNKRKEDLITLRKKEYDEIRKKEDEHDEYLKVVGEQLETEKRREAQKSHVNTIRDELSALHEEKAKLEGDIFDAIIKAVRDCDVNLINISLISKLSQENIKIIPQCKEDKAKIIDILERRKLEAKAQLVGKVQSINDKIKDITERLAAEKEVLDSMPISDVRIERKN